LLFWIVIDRSIDKPSGETRRNTADNSDNDADEDKTGRKSINSAGDSRQSIDNRRNDDTRNILENVRANLK